MKMKTTSRFLCMVLVLVLGLSCLLACKDTPPAETEPNDTPAATEGAPTTNAPDADNQTTGEIVETKPTVDANGYELDDLPELDYRDANGNVTVLNIFAWKDAPFKEFETEELDPSDIVENALYQRRITVNERLGVDVQYTLKDGDADYMSQFIKEVQLDFEGDQRFDAIAAYSMATATCSAMGYLTNLLSDDCSYIDLDKPWWPEALVTEASVKDNLYFVSGDISNNALNMMYLCLVNTDLLEEYNLENPQQFVKTHEWTYEKFIQYCTGIYEDRDGVPGKTHLKEGGISDLYGYMSHTLHMDPFFYNTGATIAIKDADGNLVANPDFASEKVQNTLTMLTNLIHNTDYAFCITSGSTPQRTNFRDGNLLFTTDRARITHEYLIFNEDLNYSVLPCPVYDEDTEYVTVMGNVFSLYGIPAYVKSKGRLEMTCAYLEALASYSYRTLSPALFEVSFKIKYADSPLTAEIYDLIRDKVSYDLGRIYADTLIGQKHFRDAIEKNTAASWSYVTKMALDTLNKKLPELQASLTGEN